VTKFQFDEINGNQRRQNNTKKNKIKNKKQKQAGKHVGGGSV
jgi:hypothetical protein